MSERLLRKTRSYIAGRSSVCSLSPISVSISLCCIFFGASSACMHNNLSQGSKLKRGLSDDLAGLHLLHETAHRLKKGLVLPPLPPLLPLLSLHLHHRYYVIFPAHICRTVLFLHRVRQNAVKYFFSRSLISRLPTSIPTSLTRYRVYLRWRPRPLRSRLRGVEPAGQKAKRRNAPSIRRDTRRASVLRPYFCLLLQLYLSRSLVLLLCYFLSLSIFCSLTLSAATPSSYTMLSASDNKFGSSCTSSFSSNSCLIIPPY